MATFRPRTWRDAFPLVDLLRGVLLYLLSQLKAGQEVRGSSDQRGEGGWGNDAEKRGLEGPLVAHELQRTEEGGVGARQRRLRGGECVIVGQPLPMSAVVLGEGPGGAFDLHCMWPIAQLPNAVSSCQRQSGWGDGLSGCCSK